MRVQTRETRRTICQRVVADVVARLIRKDEEDGNLGRDLRLALQKLLHRHRPPHVAAEQAGRTRQIHLPPGEPPHEQRHGDRVDQIPAVESDVDLPLQRGVLVPDELQEVGKVVRDERVAGPLREQAEEGAYEDALAHAGGGDHVEPGTLRVLHFEADRRFDLGHFGEGEVGLGVSFCMVVDQYAVRFFALVLGDEVAWRFRNETVNHQFIVQEIWHGNFALTR